MVKIWKIVAYALTYINDAKDALLACDLIIFHFGENREALSMKS